MSLAVKIAIIAALGAIGTLLRFAVAESPLAGRAAASQAPLIPWHTISINLLGAFMIGIIYALPSTSLSAAWKTVIAIGLLGALTTFSTIMWEAFRMIEAGRFPLAAGYLFGTVAAGLVLVAAGAWISRNIVS